MVNQDGLRVSLGFWGPARRSEVQPGEWGLASSRMGQLIGSEGQPEGFEGQLEWSKDQPRGFEGQEGGSKSQPEWVSEPAKAVCGPAMAVRGPASGGLRVSQGGLRASQGGLRASQGVWGPANGTEGQLWGSGQPKGCDAQSEGPEGQPVTDGWMEGRKISPFYIPILHSHSYKGRCPKISPLYRTLSPIGTAAQKNIFYDKVNWNEWNQMKNGCCKLTLENCHFWRFCSLRPFQRGMVWSMKTLSKYGKKIGNIIKIYIKNNGESFRAVQKFLFLCASYCTGSFKSSATKGIDISRLLEKLEHFWKKW